jgi:DNA repair photolyase
MCQYRKFNERWGTFVDVKVNIVDALKRQILKIKSGPVTISSVTDPYQFLEKKYQLTRQCLQILAQHNFQVALLTKSTLITRDIDILQQFNTTGRYSMPGITITCLDDQDALNFEPGAPPTSERFRALQQLDKAGIKTLVFLGPFIPGVSDKNLEHLFQKFRQVGVDYLICDKLNLKCGNWTEIKKILDAHYPSLSLNFINKFLKSDYYSKIKEQILELAKKYHISCEVIYH